MKISKQVAIKTLEEKIEKKKDFLSAVRLTPYAYKEHKRELSLMEIQLKELRSPTMN